MSSDQIQSVSDRYSSPTRTESTSSTDNSMPNSNSRLTFAPPFSLLLQNFFPSMEPNSTVSPQAFNPQSFNLFPWMDPSFQFNVLRSYHFIQFLCHLMNTHNGQQSENLLSTIESPSFLQRPLELGKPNETSSTVDNQENSNEAGESVLESLESPRSSQGIRRQYTEMELNFALHKIKTGEMGTRRASVAFNIPRSTLRNKMNKSREITQKPQLQPTEASENKFEALSAESQPRPLPSFLTHCMKLFQENQRSVPSLPLLSQLQDSLPVPEQKPVRGKRGQYRRYKKESLDKAIAAVRAGMSVHKAGTMFSVPHSTLVKDRSRKGQLRRLEEKQRKKEEGKNQLGSSPSVDTCPNLSPVELSSGSLDQK